MEHGNKSKEDLIMSPSNILTGNNEVLTSSTYGIEYLKTSLLLLESYCLVDQCEALETLLIYMNNIILYPLEKKFRKIRTINQNYLERLGHMDGGQQCLLAIGFALSDFNNNNQLLVMPSDLYSTPGVNDQILHEMVKIVKGRLKLIRNQLSLTAKHKFPPTDKGYQFSAITAATTADEIGRRSTMEDEYIAIDKFNNDPDQALFALYDGHGGRETVDFILSSFHLNLLYEFQLHPFTPAMNSIEKAYSITDSQIRRRNIFQSGSTAVTAFIRKEDNGRRMLYIANVGDTRAVLCRNGKAIRMTKDHRATDPEEAKRVITAGGFIGRFNRVNGVLAISRAFGDHMLKPIVSVVPHTQEIEITNEDSFLLLACDGLWDVMTDQKAVEFVSEILSKNNLLVDNNENNNNINKILRNADLTFIPKALVAEAINRKSTDNVTVMIIWL